MNQTYSKSTYSGETFYPLRFSFCENAQSAIPLIALQYHDVELRITWGATATADAEVYVQFIHLDTDERPLCLPHHKTCLLHKHKKLLPPVPRCRNSTSTTQSSFGLRDAQMLCRAHDKLKLQINGTDVTDAKTVIPHFTSAPIYYHTSAGESRDTT